VAPASGTSVFLLAAIAAALGPGAIDLAHGRFNVGCLERSDYETILEVDRRYADFNLGLADCALVVLANRYDTTRILSFDERHFRAVAPLAGGAFTILPADD
jgi:uncharacterized protein